MMTRYPQLSGYWLLLTAVLMVLLQACAIEPKYGASATSVTVSASEIDSDVRDDFDRAVSYLKENDYDKAIELLKTVIQQEKRVPAPFINLGMAYIKKGDNKLAEEYLRKALDLDLGHPIANNELGLLYRRLGRFDDAKKAYENALAVYPDYLPALKNLGILCEIYLRDLPCALQHFQAYQSYVPDDKTVNIWIADLKRRSGQ